MVLACRHMRSLQLLCTAGGNQARLNARTECKILEHSLKGGEAGRKHSCILRIYNNIITIKYIFKKKVFIKVLNNYK